MTRTIAALVAALVLAGAAHAQDAAPGPREGSVVSFVWENDWFAGSDRNYTNGLRAEYVSAANHVNPWLRRVAGLHPFIELEGTELRQGLALSHTIFTPDDITDPDPAPDAHPYAGYLGLAGFATARTGNVERTAMIEIGLVGPSAGGEFVQENWHRLLEGDDPKGWDTQLSDELVFALSGQRLHRFAGPEFLGLETDAVLHAGASLGTLRTDISAGASVRIGRDLRAEYAPPRLRPALAPSSLFTPGAPAGGYVFAGVGGYAVARDVFLDGNTWADSRSVDKHAFTGDLQAGLAVHFARHRFAFTWVRRSEQFAGQDIAHAFAAVSLSYAF
ncbi:lipid A deacylase LpxR family protein [Marinicauda algicola]|uniref:Lipid A deacylase LpxR family protein n=1 Tax=Marinicauda algicola TaxID=2029849 RepID=A0A4S2GXS0_9PROT|nr:lipid A deacylase LpxR family protein [Marinicauda algicola]TGY87572.1 lipid A deacylase LpxR family protein [Marinicauda algicola]